MVNRQPVGVCRSTTYPDGPMCGADASLHAIILAACSAHPGGHVDKNLALCSRHEVILRRYLVHVGALCHPFDSACELPGSLFHPAENRCILTAMRDELTVAHILAASSPDDVR